jgi:branched-chain amino acid transport system permease protein
MEPRALLKDAGLAAFVAFMLALPMVGFQTIDVSGGRGITVVTRFADVAISVALVFLGRLALGLLEVRSWRVPILVVTAALAVGLPLAKPPFPVIAWLATIASAVIAIRAAWLVFDLSARIDGADGDRLGDLAAVFGRWFGPAFIVFAVVFPFLPTTSTSASWSSPT